MTKRKADSLLPADIELLPPWEIVKLSKWTPTEQAAMDRACTCRPSKDTSEICQPNHRDRAMRCQGRVSRWAKLIELKRKALIVKAQKRVML